MVANACIVRPNSTFNPDWKQRNAFRRESRVVLEGSKQSSSLSRAAGVYVEYENKLDYRAPYF